MVSIYEKFRLEAMNVLPPGSKGFTMAVPPTAKWCSYLSQQVEVYKIPGKADGRAVSCSDGVRVSTLKRTKSLLQYDS